MFDLDMNSGVQRPRHMKVGFEINSMNEQTHDKSILIMMYSTESYCKIGSELISEIRMYIISGVII